MRRKSEVREVDTSAKVVGLFMHTEQVGACGEPGFWCTEAPKSASEVVTAVDLGMNGHTPRLDFERPESSMFPARKPVHYVTCCRCGHWMLLTIKRYRAIPRTSDEVKRAKAEGRGIALRD